MTFKEQIVFVWRLPLKRKMWLAGAFLGSIISLLIIYVLPSRYIKHFLGHSLSNRQFCVLVTQEQDLIARQIASLVKTVAHKVPWPCECLAQALCVNWLLKLERVPSVTYLGAKIESNTPGGMKAHAWIDVGSKTVIGGPQHQYYKVVATFTNPQV